MSKGSGMCNFSWRFLVLGSQKDSEHQLHSISLPVEVEFDVDVAGDVVSLLKILLAMPEHACVVLLRGEVVRAK
jgi:hypothetical protein